MTRTLLIAALGLAACATPASATTLQVTCDRATFHVGDVPERAWELSNTRGYLASGVAAGEVTVTFTPPLQGDDTWTLRTGSYRDPLVLQPGPAVKPVLTACVVPWTRTVDPPPRPPDTPVQRDPTPPPVPPVPEATPQPRLTCADLRARGAGIKWLRRFGCVTPPRADRPCPPALRNVLRNGAGARWVRIARERGCIAPAPVPAPPVTG